MVVFSKTIDRNISTKQDPTEKKPEDNHERMSYFYTLKSIKETRSYGFYQYPDVKVLYVPFDMMRLQIPGGIEITLFKV